MEPLYDEIGRGYSGGRRADPRIEARIFKAMGGAKSLVNVGAGAGSYEPSDRQVIAIEPAQIMTAQRSPERIPAVIAQAETLPLVDDCVDAAMGILTIHHWDDPQRGIDEMKRVARDRIVLLTVDPLVSGQMWLLKRYFPEIAQRDTTDFPAMVELVGWLGERTTVSTVPVPSDCQDGFLLSFWSDPEAVLNDRRRASTSGFARLDSADEAAGLQRLENDLESGRWDELFGMMREFEEFDAGLRLLTCPLRDSQPPPQAGAG